MHPAIRLTSTLLLALTFAGAALSQTSEGVQFAPGNYGTMVSGSITGQAYADYKLRASAGQEIFAEIAVAETDGSGTAYFNILPPGSAGEAIYIGSMDVDNSETVPLPEDGVYTIRVYLMGNDADAGKTVSYTLDLSIQ
jgi:hypothetical protein